MIFASVYFILSTNFFISIALLFLVLFFFIRLHFRETNKCECNVRNKRCDRLWLGHGLDIFENVKLTNLYDVFDHFAPVRTVSRNFECRMAASHVQYFGDGIWGTALLRGHVCEPCEDVSVCSRTLFARKQQGVGRSLLHSEYLGKCTPGDQIIQFLLDYLTRSTTNTKYLIR